MSTVDLRKSTVVSICPFAIREVIPTIYPNEYFLPEASYPHGIETLIIENAKGYVYMDSERGSLKVNIDSAQIANSLVNDYLKTVLGYKPDAYPGLFWVQGDFNVPDLVKNHEAKLNTARKIQDAWLVRLVTLADDDWNKFHQHKMISGLQRKAAESLGLEREWITAVPDESRICPMCRTQVHPMAVLCGNCKYILQPEQYAKMKSRIAVE